MTPAPPKLKTRTFIEWQDHFGYRHRYNEKHKEANALKRAQPWARRIGKGHRLIGKNGPPGRIQATSGRTAAQGEFAGIRQRLAAPDRSGKMQIMH